MGQVYIAFLNEARTSKPISRRLVVLLAIVCIIAMGVSGYLAWVALTSSKVAGCGGGRLFNCGHVISSRWSLWMGIPVSVLAFALYSLLGASLFVESASRFNQRLRYIGRTTIALLGLSAGMAAVWFISLQVLVLNHLCSYCLVAHSCGLVAAGVIVWNKVAGTTAMRIVVTGSLVGVATLIGGQLMTAPPNTYQIETFETPAAEPEVFDFGVPATSEASGLSNAIDRSSETTCSEAMAKRLTTQPLPTTDWNPILAALFHPHSALTMQVVDPAIQQGQVPQTNQANGTGAGSTTVSPTASEKRFVTINGGTIKLDVAQIPIVGSQKAKYIFVEMFDYACPHCRRTHEAIKGASAKLNGDLAILALPVPLNAACNNGIQVTDPKFQESCETAKLAIAVWRTDAAQFTKFHNWLFTGEAVPTFASAKAYAETLVDPQKLATELKSQVPGQYIAKNVELYKRVGSGNVPKLLFSSTSIVGEFNSIDGLVEVIQREIR
jgi:protein-disulfide isomerase/uncharacterized membrane protein